MGDFSAAAIRLTKSSKLLRAAAPFLRLGPRSGSPASGTSRPRALC
jgi:hypothetical protein